MQKHSEQLIDDFLNEFANLPLDTMTDEESLRRVQQLKESLLAKGKADTVILQLLEGY